MERTRRAAPRATHWPSLAEGAVVVLAIAIILYFTVAIWHTGLLDVAEYHHYAQAFWQQPPRFSALPREYPPLALLPFSLTLLFPTQDPLAVFAWGMALVTLLSYLAFRRWSTRRRALLAVGYLLLAESAMLLARYDLVPALVTVGALWAARRRRFALAYALLAVGTLLKLYPLALVPVVLIEHWHTLRRPLRADGRPGAGEGRRQGAPLWVAAGALLCGGLIALGFGAAYARNPAGVLAPFRYAAQRPVQIESLPATVVWLASLRGVPLVRDYNFGSFNLLGPLPTALAPLGTLAMLVGCLVVYWRQARGRLPFPVAFLASVVVLLATNRVLSPQYFIWVLPLVAEVEGLDVSWLLICALTAAEVAVYPFSLDHYTEREVGVFLLLVALRNALLLAATLRLVFRRGCSQSPRLVLHTGAPLPAAREDIPVRRWAEIGP